LHQSVEAPAARPERHDDKHAAVHWQDAATGGAAVETSLRIRIERE
jgi:hypothetical protein